MCPQGPERANTADAAGHLVLLAVLRSDQVPLVTAVHTCLFTELRRSRIVTSLYPHVEIFQWPYLRLTKLESGTNIQGIHLCFLKVNHSAATLSSLEPKPSLGS